MICKPNKKVATIAWLCMSYDNKSKVTVAGKCIYSHLGSFKGDRFIEQPIAVTELDNFTCGWLNRTGLLCSHCRNQSHGIAVLSYRYECVECLGSIYGWLLYFTLVLVPVTLHTRNPFKGYSTASPECVGITFTYSWISFKGVTKNGTNNTLDYRYFAGLYLLIRFINYISRIHSDWSYTIII